MIEQTPSSKSNCWCMEGWCMVYCTCIDRKLHGRDSCQLISGNWELLFAMANSRGAGSIRDDHALLG
jgi:hypothetical protein